MPSCRIKYECHVEGVKLEMDGEIDIYDGISEREFHDRTLYLYSQLVRSALLKTLGKNVHWSFLITPLGNMPYTYSAEMMRMFENKIEVVNQEMWNYVTRTIFDDKNNDHTGAILRGAFDLDELELLGATITPNIPVINGLYEQTINMSGISIKPFRYDELIKKMNLDCDLQIQTFDSDSKNQLESQDIIQLMQLKNNIGHLLNKYNFKRGFGEDILNPATYQQQRKAYVNSLFLDGSIGDLVAKYVFDLPSNVVKGACTIL